MHELEFNWDRLWIPVRVGIKEGTGYFGRSGRVTSADAELQDGVPLDALSKTPCLVLLGMPGIGKTTEMRRAANRARQRHELVDLVSLGRLSGASELDFISSSENCRLWRLGQSTWTLFLDGLDEALAQLPQLQRLIPNLISTLAAEKGDLENLRLRISCRAAEWPDSFEDDLLTLWDSSGVQLYQLCNLSRQDVASASQEILPPAEQARFLDEIAAARLDPLASRPVTFNMLLRIFRQDGKLPRDQVQLYRRGLLALIEEANATRRSSRQTGRLDIHSKLMVAARIAAATILSNSSEIWLGRQAEVPSSPCLVLSEIGGGYEPALGSSFSVGDPELREVILTALFWSVGREAVVWAHHTFAEFLCAYYLVEHELLPEEVLGILRSSDETSTQVPPQLREVAAWVASMQPEFFRLLLTSEPDILLRSDVASSQSADRQALVAELLRRLDAAEIHDFSPDFSSRYAQLTHSKLASQLKPYFIDKQKNRVVRRVAIDIAEAARLTELGSALVEVALNKSDDVHIRAQATAALSKIGNESHLAQLRPLVVQENPEDIDDEIRGWALRALWPTLISVSDLVSSLTAPKNDHLIGAYWMFLNPIVVPPLTPQEAIAAVDWATKIVSGERSTRIFDRAIARFLVRAWDQLDVGSVGDSFVEFFLAAVRGGQYLSRDDEVREFYDACLLKGGSQRQQLIRLLIRRSADAGYTVGWMLAHRPVSLVTSADLAWLLDDLTSVTSELPPSALIEIIVSLTYDRNINDLAQVWEAASRLPALQRALEFSYSVDLSSAVAKWQREDFLRRRAASERKKPQFDAVQDIETQLSRIQAHSSYDWWQFNLFFFRDSDGNLDPDAELKSNLTKSTLWGDISKSVRDQIVQAARQFLDDNKFHTTGWIGTSTFHRPAAAAYRALRLLYSESPADYDSLSIDIWKTWSPAVFGVSFNDDVEETDVRKAIVKRCYELAPVRARKVISRILLKDSSEFTTANLLAMLAGSFDEQLRRLLWSFLQRCPPGDARSLRVIKVLIRDGFEPAVELAEHALTQAGPVPNTPLANGVVAAATISELLRARATSEWDRFKTLLGHNPQLGLDVFENLSTDWHSEATPFYRQLNEEQLAEVFLWTYRNMPPPTENPSGRARFVHTADNIDEMRNGVLRELLSRGTAASVVATKSLSDSLPELPWLKWQVINARKEFNAKNWRRLSPRRAVERILSYRPTLPVRSTKAAIKAAVASSQEPLPFSTERSFEGEVPETVPLAVPGDSEQTVKLATRRILCVATEWTSGHGGLSTLNRDLCIALASVGHEVACVVRDASVHEIATAAAFKVQVVSCPNYPAAGDADRLFLFNPSVLPEFVPEVVMGHGLISGAPAYHIARSFYGGLPYIHFVHTLPEEIEPYKSRTGKSFFQGAKKADIQFRQCKNAQLVVAIGPRIFREVHTILAASADVRVTQLRPGLNRRLLDNSIDLGKPRSKYCLFMGRLEDADVKGAELACRAVHKVISGWSMGPKPKLIMRGFNSEEEASSIPGLDVVKPYLSIRPYTSDIETIETDIRSSSAIVMPSKREGFGLVALEGISAGIPILVSAESGLAELLLESDVANAIGQPIADLCVVDVDGESDLIIGTWADRLRTILSEPSSFLRANQLRSALRPILTWEKAAALLTADIEIILGSNSRNSSASREI